MTNNEFQFRIASYKRHLKAGFSLFQAACLVTVLEVAIFYWGLSSDSAHLWDWKGYVVVWLIVFGGYVLTTRSENLQAARQLFLACPNCKSLLIDHEGKPLVHDDHCGFCHKLIVSDDPTVNLSLDQLQQSANVGGSSLPITGSKQSPTHIRGGFAWEYSGYFGRLFAQGTVWVVKIFIFLAVIFFLFRLLAR